MRDLYSVGLIISLITLICACSGSPSGNGSSSADPDPNFATETHPDADSFSLSIETLNPEALRSDGITSSLTIRLADNLNDRTVLEGTEIFFSAEGGSIDNSCTVDESGVCSATWVGQDPRPADGRAAILAWTTGTESFTDLNSSGFFDDNDSFDLAGDLSEPYRDDDHDGERDENEFFVDFDGDNTFDEPDGLYSGVSCAHTSLCAPSQFLYIFGNATIIMSGSYAFGYFNGNLLDSSSSTIEFTVGATQTSANFFVILVDELDNPLPAGTSISIENDLGSATISPETYPNTTQPALFAGSLAISEDDPPAVGTIGTIKITTQTPLAIVTTVYIHFLVTP